MTLRKLFTPRPYQQLALEHLLDVPCCALWAGMGMGKTVSALTVLDLLSLTESAPALVVAPLRVARRVWPKEAQKWEHLRGIGVRPIVGTASERKAALRDPNANVFTINYENLPWLLDQDHWPFSTIVADESTKLKGFRLKQGGQRARALGRVAHVKAKRFIELTGTPAPNGLIDLWGQAWFLDAGQRLGRTFGGFTDRWFQSVPGNDGYRQMRPLKHAQAEIEERLRDICLTLDPRDYFDIHEPVHHVVEVDLPHRARDLYRQFERELFMELDGHDVEAFNAASKSMKCLQLANGAVYTEGDTWSVVHDAKLDALEDIIEEAAGMPVLLAYQFKSDLARLREAFPRGRWLADEREFDQFLTGDYPVGFAHPASMGHGVDGLQDVTNIVAFFGHWWDLELRQQMIERVGPVRQIQSGYDRLVHIYDIVAVDTIDEQVVERHVTKAEVQDLLLAAMKRRACS